MVTWPQHGQSCLETPDASPPSCCDVVVRTRGHNNVAATQSLRRQWKCISAVLERILESNSGSFFPQIAWSQSSSSGNDNNRKNSSEFFRAIRSVLTCPGTRPVCQAWLMESQKCWTSPPLSVRRWSLNSTGRRAGGRAAIKTKAGRSGHVGRARSSVDVCEKPVYLPPWLWLSTEST